MYRIVVKIGSRWRCGVNDYTYEQALDRLKQLNKVGITAQVKPVAELFR